MPDGEIDVCLFNGGIRTSEQEYMARLAAAEVEGAGGLRLVRQRGLHPGLGQPERPPGRSSTQSTRTDLSTENPQGVRPQTETEVPEGTLHLPVFYDTLKTLDQTVEVDYYLPGCPPGGRSYLGGHRGDSRRTSCRRKGSVIGADTTVCDYCPRTRNEKKIKEFNRTWQIIPDDETCLLEQGLSVLRHRHAGGLRRLSARK